MTATTVPAAVAPDVSVSNRLPRGAALSDALVIAGRNVKHLLRTPQLLVASVAQTVMFLLLFRYVFGGSIQIPDMTFVDYLIPGYLATIAIFDGFGVSIFFAEDSKSGLIERFRALPMARSAVVGGRAIADLLRQAALLAITTLVGVAVGFGFAGSFGDIVLAYVIALVWGFALFWVFAAIGLFVRDAETAQAASTPFFILVFVSSAIIDVNTLPGWLQPFAAQPAAVTGVQRDARADGRQRGRGAGRALDQPLRAHVVHLVRGDHRGVRAAGDLRIPTSLITEIAVAEPPRGGLLADALHGPLGLPLGVALGEGLALVVVALAPGKGELDLRSAVPEVDPERHEGGAALREGALDLDDLLAVQEQLALADGIELFARVGVGQHVHPEEPELVVVDAGVGVLQVGAAFAHRLDLGAREHDPGFPRVEDVVVVPRLAVGDDELVAAPAHRQHGTACSRTVREECSCGCRRGGTP